MSTLDDYVFANGQSSRPLEVDKMGADFEIDTDRCVGCKLCNKVCFVDIFRWDEENDLPVAAYPEDCAGCFACELYCPAQCINVVPRARGPFPDIVY